MTEIGNAYDSVALKPQRKESLHDLQGLHCAQLVMNQGRDAVVQSYAVGQITGALEFQSQQGPNQLSGSTLLSNADSEPSPRDKEVVTEDQPSPPCKACIFAYSM